MLVGNIDSYSLAKKFRDVVTGMHRTSEIYSRKNEKSIYEPTQTGRIYPEVPRFSTLDEERRHRKERLVAGCRAFALEKFDYGMAGHLTVRDPEHSDMYWTNPMAVHFSQVKMSNLILADHEGTVVEGSHAVNRAGFVLHAAVHDMHPDIIAMCHAHTVYGTAFASLGRELSIITQDTTSFFEDHAVIKDDAGKVAVEVDAGSRIAQSFKNIRAAIHQNHGLFTASRHSIEAATFTFIALERCCKQQLAVEATGINPIELSPEVARYSRENVGTEYIAWLCFQPIWGLLEETQPDMFD